VGILLHSYAVVCKPIELTLGVVIEVGRGMSVLDGVPRAARGRGDFGKLTVFLYVLISLETFVHSPSEEIVRFKIEVRVYE